MYANTTPDCIISICNICPETVICFFCYRFSRDNKKPLALRFPKNMLREYQQKPIFTAQKTGDGQLNSRSDTVKQLNFLPIKEIYTFAHIGFVF